MELFERQNSLDELIQLVKDVTAGEGKTVLLSGEAGIGKTSLIKKFAKNLNEEIEVLWGGCDALFTPRPLGPLYDIAHQTQSNLKQLLGKEEKRVLIFNSFLSYLENNSRIIIFVIEDIHWADEATLDLIKFLARRINRTKCILILSYRDDEIGQDHPLRSILGDLPNSEVSRIRLYPLSEIAVDTMMKDAGIKYEKLYEQTGGNPFYVTEILSNKDGTIPISIKDAVNARIAKLSDKAKELLNTLCIIPSGAKITMLHNLFKDSDKWITECIISGAVILENELLSFRHELARLAITESIPDYKRQLLHESVLNYLLRDQIQEDNLARIIHHASEAKSMDVIIKYAPLAAKHSSLLGAHREAAAHYKTFLAFSDSVPQNDLGIILEKYSYECYLTDQLDSALDARKKTLSIWEKNNEVVKIGTCYRWISRISWFMGNKKDADNYASKAIETLENSSNKKELAMAYSNQSQLFMLSSNQNEAKFFGEKAMVLAESINDNEILSHALNNIGTSELQEVYSESGESKLLKSLEIALDNGFEEHAARAYTNLGCLATENKIYEIGNKYLNEGINYCIEHDLDSWVLYMRSWLSRLNLEIGNWDEAGNIAQLVLSAYKISEVSKIPAMTTLGWVRLRRGDPESVTLLNEVYSSAIQTGELQRIGPVTAALLEAAWLNSEFNKVRTIGNVGYEMAMSKKDPWVKGQLSFWLWRCDEISDIPDGIAKPYQLQMQGDWSAAAKFWKELKCPYEQALALADGDDNSKKEALTIFESLGANATINLLKKQMRKEGIKNIPKGPRKTTQQNPAGLTARQMDVLKLLAKGLSNSDIANKLFISPKTVEHHISAILQKLNLHTRMEAAVYARSNILV